VIGRLSGTVVAVEAETLVLDIQGVGYEAYGTGRLLAGLGLGDRAVLAIETVVREDMIRLYAFRTEAERKVFRMLQTVQGVGAKAALAILDVLSPSELLDAVAVEDWAAVARARGVGRKIAERVVGELRGAMPSLTLAATGAVLPGAPSAAEAAAPQPAPANEAAPVGARAKSDAVSALANLGYEAGEARAAVARAAAAEASKDVADLVRRALKELSAA